ncbi:DUF3592 domain-containing protein [Microtetraspora glauca]|uniref:DUF3592 domain-containing protein n=1 Tax=Microtetraspora glauca TaxID=1996 RepID=A0ABV3GTU6_MICGL
MLTVASNDLKDAPVAVIVAVAVLGVALLVWAVAAIRGMRRLRRRAYRTTGSVIRREGVGTLRVLFVGPDGREREVVVSAGTGWGVRGQAGQQVPLLVDPENPSEPLEMSPLGEGTFQVAVLLVLGAGAFLGGVGNLAARLLG